MRRVVRTPANSLLLGTMPKGCRLCIRGAKLVLFVTGLCKRGCFYCPLSESRKDRDVVFANERPVKSNYDILEEAKLIDALGTGLTGGDPSLKFQRVLRYIRLLKRKFGKHHHIHMYCGGGLSQSQLLQLKKAGLDELRFHTWSAKPVALALSIGLYAGVEIPAIPGTFRHTTELFRELNLIRCSFVNLNELEFSDTNLEALKEHGFEIKSDESMAVKGSEKLALKLLDWAARNTSLNIHYCPSSFKDAVQLRNRLRRKAKNVAKAHESITREGLLVKGVVRGLTRSRLVTVRTGLLRRYGIPPELVVIDHQKCRLELPWRMAKKLARFEPRLEFAIVEEYPTYDRLETMLIPLRRS